MKERLRGVIFDLDGTLAETHAMAVSLIGEAIARHGGPCLSEPEVMALFGRNEQGIFREAVGDGWERAWEFYLDSYISRHREASEPFPGIVDLLDDLGRRRLHLGVITAKTLTTGTLSLRVLGLEQHFSQVRGGGMDGVTKHLQIDELVSLWKLDPKSVAYVGDTRSDVSEAIGAGVIAVAAGWSRYADVEGLRAAGPDHLFDAVSDLARWLADAGEG